MNTVFTFPNNELHYIEFDDSQLLGMFKDYKATDIGLLKNQRLIYLFEKRNGYIVAIVPQKEVKYVIKLWEDMQFVGFEDREIKVRRNTYSYPYYQSKKKTVVAAHFKHTIIEYHIWSYSRIEYKDGKLE